MFGSFGSSGGAQVYVGADTKDFRRKLAGAGRLGRQFAKDLSGLGRNLLNGGLISGAGLGLAAREFAQVDDALRATAAIADATDDQLNRLRGTVQALGKDTSFTARDIAGLTTELARGGQSIEQIADALPGILNLSRGTLTPLAETGAIVVRTLGQFQLAAEEADRLSDVLASAANSGTFSLTDLGESMKLIGPLAKNLNLSVEDVSAALATLANNGVRGTDAGTQLRRILFELSDSAKQAKIKDLFKVDVTDSVGNLRRLADIVAELGPKFAQLGTAARVDTLQDLFGRGANAFAGLSAGVDDLQSLSVELLTVDGKAADLAKRIDGGLGGAFRLLVSAAQELGIQIGSAIEADLVGLLSMIRSGVKGVSEWVSENGELIRSFLKLTVAAIAIGGVVSSLLGLSAALGPVVGLIGTAAAAVSGPFAIALAAAVPLVAALGYSINDLVNSSLESFDLSAGRVTDTTRRLLDTLSEFDGRDNLSADELSKANAIVQTLEGDFGDLGVTIDETTGKIEGLAEAIERVELQKAVGSISGRVDETAAELKKAQAAGESAVTAELQAKLRFLNRELQNRKSEIEELGKAEPSTRRTADNANGTAPRGLSEDEIQKEAKNLARSLEQAAGRISVESEGAFGGQGLSNRASSQTTDIQEGLLTSSKRQESLLETAVELLREQPGLIGV